MNLTVMTPTQKVFSGPVDSVTLPGAMGPFQVLSGHAPLMSTLSTGMLRCQQAGRLHTLAVKGGVVEVLDDHIQVLLVA